MPSASPNPDPELDADPIPAAASLIDRPAPLWRTVLLLAMPVMVQHFLHLAVNLSDRFLAGNLQALVQPESGAARTIASQSAQTTAGYLAWFIGSFTLLVSVGSTALVGRFVGGRDWRAANRAMHQALLLAAALGAFGSIAGVSLTRQLVDLLQLDGAAAELAAGYLRPIFWVLALQLVESAGIACLVGAGDTVSGMRVLLGIVIVNIPLSWGLFQGWGFLPAMGFVGISTGTALSHAFGCIAVLVILARGRSGLRLELRRLRPDWSLMRRLLRISVPAAVNGLSMAVGQLCFLSIVNQLGDVAGAAHGLALQWEALGYLSGAAFGTAATTLVSQNLGAQRPRQAAQSGWTAFRLGLLVMCVMGAVFYLLAEPMFLLFCPSAGQRPIVDAGVPALRLVAFAMPGVAASIVLMGALHGAGDTRLPILFTWAGFAVRLSLAYWLTQSLGWGLIGAWWAMFADIYFRGAALFIRFATGGWKRIVV